MKKPVAVFTLPQCRYCDELKLYLKNKKIKFNQIDVSKNKKALQDCIKHGCKGAPVVLIGNTWICGFDKKKIEKELSL